MMAAVFLLCCSISVQCDEAARNVKPCMEDWICFDKPMYNSTIGIWYESWWESTGPRAHRWEDLSRYKPTLGTYSSDRAEILSTHFKELIDAGIDFLLSDDTNLVNAHQYAIHNAIKALFKWDEEQKASGKEYLEIAMVIGGELWMMRSLKAQQVAADYVFREFANSPVYFFWKGKPLLIVYNAYGSANVFAPKWNDPRFTVRIATGIVDAKNRNEQKYAARGWWGWVQTYPQPVSREVVGVSPGGDNAHRHCSGCDFHLDRDGGRLYMSEWLRAIKSNPAAIVISSWNEFSDETAIEPASARPDGSVWADSYGNEVPDWYLQITTAYAALRRGLLPGVSYQDEDDKDIYTVESGTLVKQTAPPQGKPVILLPAGTLKPFLPKN